MPELLKTEFHALPDGGRLRYARLEPAQKPRGTILIAPGRREFIEKKQAELGAELVQRGFRVIIFEFRGQGLSTRLLKENRRQRDHIADFALYIDDLRSLYLQVVVPAVTGPLIASGHSLGGHLLLRWLADDNPAGVAGILLTSPMLALTMKFAQHAAQTLCRIAVQTGHGEDYAPGQHDYAPHDRIFANNPLTQDPERFTIIERYFDAVPDLTVGGVTWNWLYAALQSLHKMETPDYLARIAKPVLAIVGGKDHVTPATQVMHYLKFLPSAEVLMLSGALHDVMNEIDTYRLEAWAQIDRFLGKITA